MNVSDIIAQNTTAGRRRSMFTSAGSFLNIGRRGQVVQGVVSKVADKVSIRFNDTEAAVPLSSVHNATEGETRSFKIMEVSKDKIVLKEVGTDASSESRAMTGTSVSASSYSFADHLSDAGKLSEAKQQAGQNIAVLTGEDYQNMESEQGALEEYKASALDRAVERHKERREWQQESAERNIENSKEFQENIKTLQEQGVTQFMSPEEIERALREADLPVTKSNVARVASAVQMAEIVPGLSQDAKAYLLENQMAPTIENLYHGQYSASGALSSSMADEEAWQQLQGQITELLEAGGLQADEMTMEQAKWLFANDIAVTPENIRTLQMLDALSEELTPQKLLDQIIYAMQTGAMPEQASLDDRQLVIARQAINSLAEVTDEDVVSTVRNLGQDEVTLKLLEQAVQERKQRGGSTEGYTDTSAFAAASGDTQTDGGTLTMTRSQLAELRLKLTLPAAVRMQQKGISINVTPLREIVDSLRQQEREDYRQVMPDTGISDTMLDRAGEILDKTSQISTAPASILAIGVRQHSLLTMNVLHGAAVSAVAQTRQYQADYEAVGTQVRTDLGDSIQKAFQNVPDLLGELGMEDTQANQRAVRILGYNSMEITEQNVLHVKQLDAQVGSVLDQMKPSVVLKLVQEGEDPLDLPLQELEDKLNRIVDAQDISSEERYTRYLMRMEQDQSISEQEREGYIGLYRLLHQVESSDGAAIGSVMEAGWDMTLRNLLTAVRTEKRKGVDARVDDQFGGLSDIRYSAKSITQQIDQAFAGEKETGSSDQDSRDETQAYYERLNRQLLREITPSAVKTISDGDMEQLLDQSLESFHDAVDQTAPDAEVEEQLYSQMAQKLRETMEQSSDSARYLGQLGISETIVNIHAAELLLEQNYDVYHQVYEKRDRLSAEEQQELADAMDAVSDSLEDAQSMQQSSDRLGGLMETVLSRSYEAHTITGEELRGLRQLHDSMLLQRSMARRHSYDVPVTAGDDIATMNVTLIQGAEDSGKVQIYMEDLSAEFRIAQGEVKGLLLCGSRDMYEQLSGKAQDLASLLETNGFPVKNISYSMNPKSRVDTMNTPVGEKEPATALYKAAKLIVKHVIRSTTAS